MKSKDRLYMLIAIFSGISLITSIILKAVGVDWFNFDKEVTDILPLTLSYGLSTIMLIIQGFLIVGCVTRYDITRLMREYSAWIPLNAIFFLIPREHIILLSTLVMVTICFAIKFKFSTIIGFIINIPIIMIMQLALIWIRTGYTILENPYFDSVMLVIMNIDQFILLILLYYANRKVGEWYAKLVFSRKNRSKQI